ncbi:uncharacterized protein LOC115884110 [Sitophilus oryzae]|uniref:Uncharacterized protein LOC115884110 n=1 Tax=Sitophilus oryzae TaxID=7048 RepID=A0A6J2Y5D5_SITOR|nr:uncharacterized protein LOC115884110 [Sitophilus oryzae]
MTLPTALLISNIVNKSIASEIQETIGNQSSMDILSCKCDLHSDEPYLIPTTPKCTLSDFISDKDMKKLNSNAKINSIPNKIKSAKSQIIQCKAVHTYSYFSDLSHIERITCFGSAEPSSKQELMKCLSVALDSLENIDYRFKKSYIYEGKQDIGNLKISYDKRDILDLGSNLTENWQLTHPPEGKMNHTNTNLFLRTPCQLIGCDFEDMFPLFK